MSDNCPECEAGAPLWMATFADMMSLLMAFFVLLLSFSEMDLQKFKQLSGSVKMAFGVQREINAHEIPKGTSVIMKEFSPAAPEETAFNEVRQKTVDENREKLGEANGLIDEFEVGLADVETAKQQQAQAELENDAREIAEALQNEIMGGQVEIETAKKRIIIRILEDVSFTSGSAELEPNFLPVTLKLREVLSRIKGIILVEGHTDNIPIQTMRFRSNWELSAARAVSVAHALMDEKTLPAKRFVVTGYADTMPRDTHATPEGRTRNRRVEVVIERGEKKVQEALTQFEVVPEKDGQPQQVKPTTFGVEVPTEETISIVPGEEQNEPDKIDVVPDIPFKANHNTVEITAETIEPENTAVPLAPVPETETPEIPGAAVNEDALQAAEEVRAAAEAEANIDPNAAANVIPDDEVEALGFFEEAPPIADDVIPDDEVEALGLSEEAPLIADDVIPDEDADVLAP